MLRGASDIQGFPDSIVVMLPTEDSQESRVIHTKMRDGEKLSPFIARTVIADGRATVAYREEASGIHSNPSRQSILDAVKAAGVVPLTVEWIAGQTGLGIATVAEHLKVLEASGAVRSRREANTKYYQAAIPIP